MTSPAIKPFPIEVRPSRQLETVSFHSKNYKHANNSLRRTRLLRNRCLLRKYYNWRLIYSRLYETDDEERILRSKSIRCATCVKSLVHRKINVLTKGQLDEYVSYPAIYGSDSYVCLTKLIARYVDSLKVSFPVLKPFENLCSHRTFIESLNSMDDFRMVRLPLQLQIDSLG